MRAPTGCAPPLGCAESNRGRVVEDADPYGLQINLY